MLFCRFLGKRSIKIDKSTSANNNQGRYLPIFIPNLQKVKSTFKSVENEKPVRNVFKIINKLYNFIIITNYLPLTSGSTHDS